MKKVPWALAVTFLAACHHGKTTAGVDLGLGGTGDAAVGSIDAAGDFAGPLGGPDASTCVRPLTAADATRTIVVSHPFDDNGVKGVGYELLSLATDGTITQPGSYFKMGTNTSGDIVFSPDGKLGYSAQEGGTIGIFSIGDGKATVLDVGFKPGAYAARIAMSNDGTTLYIIDPDTTTNHGGIYASTVHCDGTLSAATLVTPADVARALVPLSNGDWVLAARALDGAAAGEHIHRVSLAPYARLASTSGYPDSDAMVYGSAGTHDGKYALFGDGNVFTANGNRIAVVSTSTGVAATQLLTGIQDCYSIVASPYDNAALVVDGIGSKLFKLTYDPSNTAAPFANAGVITYVAANPQVPGFAIPVTRGALTGYVFIAEVSGVRTVKFETTGAINDVSVFHLGPALSQAVGVLGITP